MISVAGSDARDAADGGVRYAGVMSPDSRQVELFVTVARHLSFSRAAAELNTPQPWLSAQIRRLEDQLGFALFRRTSRKVELTDHGAVLLESAQAALDALGVFRSEITALKRGLAGTLRVGVAPYSKLFPRRVQALEDFAAAHPNVVIEIENGWSPALRDQVLSGDLDVAFSIGESAEGGLESRFVESHTPRLLLRADDPLAALDPVPVERLHDRAIITFPRTANPGLHDALYGDLAAHGAKLERLPEADLDICVRHIRRNGSLAIAFATRVPREGQGAVVVRGLAPAPDPFELFLVRRTGATSALVRSFWKAVFPEGARGTVAA
jgi:DNA-binding transcriptional LysR family regulator